MASHFTTPEGLIPAFSPEPPPKPASLFPALSDPVSEESPDFVTSDIGSRSALRQPAVAATPLSALQAAPQSQHDAAVITSVTTPSTVPQQPRKRGRPKGWKPGMPYSNRPPGSAPAKPAKAKPPAGSSSAVPKRRGRPPRQPSPTPRQIYCQLQPRYYAFLCEWEGCPAELQNLETLTRHILTVHGWHTCKWARCGVERRDEQPPKRTTRVFASPRAFADHVREAHLIPFQWHMGEGPANHLGRGRRLDGDAAGDDDDAPPPKYLLDKSGKQVTPSVRDQEVEDFATWQKNRRKLRELILERDRNAPDEIEYPDSDDEVTTTGRPRDAR